MKIDELIKKDKTFTEANLLAKVDNIFIMLLSSIMVGNLDRVKHKLSNSLFNEYNLFLNKLKESNEIQIFDELNVKINLVDENHLEFYGDMLLTRK